jgi:hypothetical protein
MPQEYTKHVVDMFNASFIIHSCFSMSFDYNCIYSCIHVCMSPTYVACYCPSPFVGALDGQLFSISKFCEDYLCWRRILVEANPYNFKKLVQNRPQSIKYNTAICRQKHIKFVGSEAVGGIEKYMSEKHKKWLDPKKFPENRC